MKADVSKVADLQKLIDAAVKEFGRLDIMVNNAGVETRTSVLDTTEAQYEKVLEINLKSAFFGTQLAAKQMIKQGGGGRIINITSVHEDWPMPGNTAVLPVEGRDAHADAHRRRRARRRTASLVVGVGPGAVATPINASTMNDPAKLKTLDAAIPLGRMAQPDGDRQRRRVSRRRRRELHHGDHRLRRRRHHAEQPRPLADDRHVGCERLGGHRRRRDRRRRVREASWPSTTSRSRSSTATTTASSSRCSTRSRPRRSCRPTSPGRCGESSASGRASR